MERSKAKRYAAWGVLAGMLMLAAGACTQGEEPARLGTNVLMLTFQTGAPQADEAGDTNTAPNEQMKTLRVIVTNDEGTILENRKVEDIAPELSIYQMTFEELAEEGTEHTYHIYAVANEEAFVTDLPNNPLAATEGTNISEMHLDTWVLTKDLLNRWNEAIDQSAPAAQCLPQTGRESVTVKPNTSAEVSVKLKFVVAKVRLTFINDTGEEQTVTGLSLGGVAPDQGYLFNGGDESGVHIPKDVNYENLVFDDQTMPVDASVTTSAYIYPSANHAFSGGYELNATWGLERKLQTGRSQLDRNKQLDIEVTLRNRADNDITINCEVLPWCEKSFDVPAFE